MKALLLLLIMLFNVIQSDSDVCDVSRNDKVDCGSYFGMSRSKCLKKKGCCFNQILMEALGVIKEKLNL